MQIGIGLAQIGRFADPTVTREVARRAEAAGVDSLWVLDRLLVPEAPRGRYPSAPDGALPLAQHQALDPLLTLAVAAGVTEQVRLGTSVLVAPWYAPVLLARALATLDRISGGRLTVGLGVGWSPDEYEAVGVPMAHRGARVEEVLEVMQSLWNGATEIETSRERIALSDSTVQPAQRPRPPVLLATYTPIGLERVARRADGWMPGALPFDVLATMWAGIVEAAERYGRDAGRLRMVVRANVKICAVTLGADRPPFTGTRRQIADDVERAREAGVHELLLDLQETVGTPAELVDTALELAGDRLAT